MTSPETEVPVSSPETPVVPTAGYLMSVMPTSARDGDEIVPAFAFQIAVGEQVVMRVVRANIGSQFLANILQDVKLHVGTEDEPTLGQLR